MDRKNPISRDPASPWTLLPLILAMAVPIAAARGAEPDYALLFRGGGSYYRVPGESRMGGGYGVEGAFPITEDVGFLAAVNGNQISGGTQLLGSTGLVKVPGRRSTDDYAALTWAVVLDQFTDSRIDTFSGSLYVNQLRWQTGYRLEDDLEFGLSGTVPLYEDDDVQFRFVNFPGSLPVAGRVDGSNSVGAWLAGHRGPLQQSLYAGYRDLPGTAQLASTTRYRLNERVAAIAAATYETDRDNWNVWLGIEFNVHSTPNRGTGSRRCIRAQSPAEPILQTGWVPPNGPFENPDAGSGEFPLNLGDEVDTPVTNDPPPSVVSPRPPLLPRSLFATNDRSFSERFVNWDGKLELNRRERDTFVSLNGKGLDDRFQDGLQGPASGGFVWQLRGDGFGRRDGRRQD